MGDRARSHQLQTNAAKGGIPCVTVQEGMPPHGTVYEDPAWGVQEPPASTSTFRPHPEGMDGSLDDADPVDPIRAGRMQIHPIVPIIRTTSGVGAVEIYTL
jgi:hypothetical protein